MPHTSPEKNEIARGSALILICLVLAIGSHLFQEMLMPISDYSMFAGLKPMPPSQILKNGSINPYNMRGKEYRYLVFGIRGRETPGTYLSYSTNFLPFREDWFWWSHLRNNLTSSAPQQDQMHKILRDLYLHSRTRLESQGFVGIRLFRCYYPFNEWYDAVSSGRDPIPKEMHEVAAYFPIENSDK